MNLDLEMRVRPISIKYLIISDVHKDTVETPRYLVGNVLVLQMLVALYFWFSNIREWENNSIANASVTEMI